MHHSIATIRLNKNNIAKAIAQAVTVLRAGGLVVYPTETCYGIGADAQNPSAIQKLFAYKRKREGKPLSVLVADGAQAAMLVELNDSAKNLYHRFLPGPMTVISKVKVGKVAPGVASELGTLGIRISSHFFAQQLTQEFSKPITATSANASWQKKPYSIEDIIQPLTLKQQQLIDLIIDAGKLPKRPASTVVDTTLVDTMVLRQGDVHLEYPDFQILSHSVEDTFALASRLMLQAWNKLRTQGLVVGLSGDLGIGKTVFVKGIGSFLKIKEVITSPSYALVQEYAYQRHGVDGKLFHIDPWRLEQWQQFLDLGFVPMLQVNQIVAIEWMSKFREPLVKLCKLKKIAMIDITFQENQDGSRLLQWQWLGK